MEAEKNKISTGTLTYEDIHNKAEYEAGSMGINIDTGKDADKNEAGVTPNIGMPAEDKAESDTKATIAEGEIEIRDKDKQKQDLQDLNRDTRNSLNKLGEIFDKTKVEEKQEFAGLFQEVAHSYIGDLTGKLSSEEKAALNSLVDGLVAEWTSGNFLAGASGTALLESMQSALNEIKDPALKQIAAGMIGAVAGEIAGGNAQAGASGAVSTEKYNHLTHEEQEKIAFRLEKATKQEEKLKIIEDALAQSEYNRQVDPGKAEDMENYLLTMLEKITKYDNAGVSFVVNKDLGLHNNLIAAEKFFNEYNVVKHLPDVFGEAVKLTAASITAPVEVVNGMLVIGDLAYEIKGNYDKFGNSKEFYIDSSIDLTKAMIFNVIGDYADKKYPGVITIITEAGIITAVNNEVNNMNLEQGE